MKIVKIIVLSIFFILVVGCDLGNKESSITCKANVGFADHNVTIKTKDGNVLKYELISERAIKKEDLENANPKLVKDAFNELYHNIKAVNVRTKYDDKNEIYVVSVTANFEKMSDEEIKSFLQITILSDKKDSKNIIKALENLDYKCE